MWQRCKEASVGTQGAHSCTFQPSNASAIAVLLNVTRPHRLPGLSYFQEPFWLHQAGQSQRQHSPSPYSVPGHRVPG